MAETNAKVFVGRLPDGCTEKDLETLFTAYGAVNQIDLIGKYGFVHMTKREEAEEAIKKLNNYNFMDSQLTVQFSTSKMNGGSGKTRGFGGRGRGVRRSVGPYNRNNSFPPSRPPVNHFGGPPPPVPPNNYGQYYDEMNGYYRDPYYQEPDPYFRPNNRRSAQPYDPSPFSRRGPPAVTEFPRAPALPVQTDYYGRGDGPYNRPLPYDRPVPPPTEPPPPPPPPPALGFGAAPARNGYGGTTFANRGPPAAPVPPPTAAARWPPY